MNWRRQLGIRYWRYWGRFVMQLYEIYNPITSTPFARCESYMEFPPCEELKPYIKCFWGSERPYQQFKTATPLQSIVTPDSCMDIIFTVDYTNNQIHGKFCGIDNRSFVAQRITNEERMLSTFAIRFYPWSAIFFSEESMCDTKNAFYDLDCHFSKLKSEIEPLLFDVTHMRDRIRLTERYLLNHIHASRNNTILMDAIAQILVKRGNVKIECLARDIHTSNRHLERIFHENIGISPKQLSSLVRYQYVWNDVLFRPGFQVLDVVERYGYTDQSHLLRDFKRFHTMNMADARNHALQHVAFLQEEIR